jgi:tRNA modification GTPase
MQAKIRTGDTIAAIATPPGEGAISIVRMSGPESVVTADRVFRGRSSLLAAAGYTIHHGFVLDEDGNEVDEVLVSVFRSPHSYTGEDLIEIGCHGGSVSSSKVLGVVLRAGARQADPGEFTKRAFLNGKIDLSQAEAVADLISSRSSRAQGVSLAQLRGALSERINRMKEDLLETCSLLEIDLDFSEEGISVIPAAEVGKRLSDCASQFRALIATYETGKIVRDGVRVVIVGPPNAGKSSLFNMLLRQDRAIVSEMPGTTRDYIEEAISIDGILFQLVDTAGVRKTDDHVEKQGVARSHELLRSGDIGLAVIDGTSPPEGDFFEEWLPSSGRLVLAINKIDLMAGKGDGGQLGDIPFRDRVPVSALTGEGIEHLRTSLLGCMVAGGDQSEDRISVTNQRHADALRRGLRFTELALESFNSGLTNEFVALDARSAVSALSEITGEITTEEILNGIFERFCIGK